MAITSISNNQLVDQTTLNQIIETVNGMSSKFALSTSPIYNTNTDQIVNAYMGTFAIATNFKKVTDHKLTANGVSKYSFPIAFNKTFQVPPLVFATIQALNETGTGSSMTSSVYSVTVANVNTSGCTIYVNIYNPTSNKADNFPYNVSIMAIGLTQV